MDGDIWGEPAFDENLEQDDVNSDVSDYEDFLAREGDLWQGKSFAEALALSDEIAEASPHDFDDMEDVDGEPLDDLGDDELDDDDDW